MTQAFTAYERGKDDQAREFLNGIALTSPYLEWKLLLRGLMAWSANDTPRALENWARLTPDRLPGRIAAPFRLSADRSFAATLPADRAHVVARQAEQITGGGLSDGLRRIRKQLASEETLPNALDTARAVVPELKRSHPEAVAQLASTFYVGDRLRRAARGHAEVHPVVRRAAGRPELPPPASPGDGIAEPARRGPHALWARYEEWIAHTPARWPGALGNRARALILERMGRLARDFLEGAGEDDEELDFFDFFGGPRGGNPRSRRSRSPCRRRPTSASAGPPNWPRTG